MGSLKGLTFPLTVTKRIQETPDTVSLVLDIPDDAKQRFNYLPGQFITLNLDINGKEVHRSYSLSSSPTVDSEFKISIKLVEGGKASGLLVNNTHEGTILNATPPAGRFFKPALEATHYILFAAGSGITPMMSILKTVLAQKSGNKTTLIYSSRFEDQIIFKSELDKLQKTYANELSVHHLISKPSDSCEFVKGRLTTELCKSLLANPDSLAKEYYLCGPDGFMETAEQALDDLRVEQGLIHKESFTAAGASETGSAFKDVEGTLIGPESIQGTPKTLSVVVNGETHSVDYKSGASALECFVEAGLNVPYSCMDGACMACLAKVTEGQVVQKDLCILTDENVRDGETLTCQCKPVTENVRFDFDDI